jgi:hypothetical protein
LSKRQLNSSRKHSARFLLALGLAICTFLFVVLSSSHIHASGQEDAACQLCQAAHIGISTALQASVLPVPLIQRAEPPRLVASVALELFLHNAPSRAPPAA